MEATLIPRAVPRRGPILAQSGGSLGGGETLWADRWALELTGRSSPRVLFVPTASGDSEGYIAGFARAYGALGARVDTLRLGRRSEAARWADQIGAADLFYVGGGNTLRLLMLWRRRGIDRLLTEAWARGAVLTGLSAGAICWHRAGHSDSRASAPGGFIRVRALGLVPGVYAPHVDSEDRLPSLEAFALRSGEVVLGADDGAAIYYPAEGPAEVRAADPRARVRVLRPSGRGRDRRLEVEAFGSGQRLPSIET